MSFAYRHIEARRFAATRAPRLLALSRRVKEQILEGYPHLADRIEVVYNPVDIDEYHPKLREQFRVATRRELRTDDDATVFLLVGNDFRRKGVTTALRALCYLPANAVLWVVGHDKRLADYEELAGRLGVPVRFAGAQQDPRRFYAAADAFVFPSRYDAFGQAALEALACGLPVIASAAAGASELIETDRSGYVLRDPDDPRELGERMLSVTNRATRERLSTTARRTAEEHSWERHFDRMLRVYEEVRAGRCSG
jgi:UDP-glucose:(heptosyl)LPS alpha-1,3-glucosyltransferase